jgi:hypothetical protein
LPKAGVHLRSFRDDSFSVIEQPLQQCQLRHAPNRSLLLRTREGTSWRTGKRGLIFFIMERLRTTASQLQNVSLSSISKRD